MNNDGLWRVGRVQMWQGPVRGLVGWGSITSSTRADAPTPMSSLMSSRLCFGSVSSACPILGPQWVWRTCVCMCVGVRFKRIHGDARKTDT